MLKKIRLILISIVLIFCFVFPLNASSESVNSYLKKGSIEDLMDIMRKEPLTDANFDLFNESIEGYNPNAPRKTGAVVLVKQAILKKQLDYWFKDMPRQLSIKFIKTSFTVISIIYSKDISKAISVIEKLSVKKATEYAINWLFQNKMKIGTGELSYSFPSYKGNWQNIKIQYIIAYHFLSQNKGEIIAEFYSKDPIEPPIGTNPYGLGKGADHPNSNPWPWDYWLDNERNRNNDGKIEPFILRIKGYVTEKSAPALTIPGINDYPTYSRNKDEYNFSIEIDFDNFVPEIENSDFILANPPSETSFKKEIIKVLLNKVKSGANSAKNFTVRKANNVKDATMGLFDEIKSLFSKLDPGADISEQIIKDQINPWEMSFVKEPDSKLTLDLTEQKVLETQRKIEREIQKILVHQDLGNLDEEQEKFASLKKMAEQLDYILKTLTEMRRKTEELLAREKPKEEEEEEKEILVCSVSDAKHTPEKNKIIFNEIAWMGTKNSSNDEWIELKNISEDTIDMSNWQILDKAEIEGKSRGINIIFENATISQGGFFLLERTDDTSVPNVVADLIYTGALNNTDEALYLFDENCKLQDKVEALPNWGYGDNGLKRTMERKTNFNWQTSENPEGTPKVQNSSGYYESSTETNSSGDTASVAGASSSGQTKKEPEISVSYSENNPVDEEIQVGLSVSGLDSAFYDVKISIEKDGVLSEIYYQNDWQSSHYYLPKIFYGNLFNGTFKLKIKKDKRDFQGQADIIVKIRENGKSKYWDYSNKINITESEEELVENQLPIAIFSYSPENPQIGQEITFNAGSSTDSDGEIASYFWDFGDGSTSQIEDPTTNHTFSASSQFQITLIVKDNQDLESNAFNKTIEILPIPKILISEIQIESSSSKKDEFIELYNPNDSDLDLTNWYVQRKTKTGSDFSSLVPKSLLSGKIIQAKNYFLIANASSTFSADVFTNYSITEDNAIFLKNPIKEVVDKVGFGQAQDFETAPTQNPPVNKSIGRKWSTTTETYTDTDNNLTDFEIQTPTPKTRNEKDLTAPETIIASGPPFLTNQTTAIFTFSSDEEGSIFQCQLDSEGWQNCLSPSHYSGLSNNTHTFYVKATDLSGNEDPEPAQYIWIIDTSIESPYLSLADSNTSSTSFTNSQTVIVNISQDAEAAAWFLSESSVKPATSTVGWLSDKPLTFDLSINNGLKTVYLWTKDAAGNVSQLGNSSSITLDTIAPQTEIEDKPLNPTNQTTAVFTFSSNEDNCIFKCQLDTTGWEDCSSSTTYTSAGLSEGSHSFQVRTTDQAGNTSINAVQYSWLMDLTPPSSQVEPLASSSTSTSFNIFWSGSDISSGILNYDIQYRDGLDGDWKDLIMATASTSAEFTGQDEHTYYFRSRARDIAGNEESLPDQPNTFIKIEIPKDEIPPESISDLQAKAGENFREIILSWTTPKDNWPPYKPSEYIIKYGLENITEENWALLTTTENVLATKDFNIKQEFIISDLDNNTRYYFAMKSKDNANNTSTISNSTSAKTLNHIPIAMFFYAPENPEIEEEITFNASDSYDIDGLIAEYTWNFGDGAAATTTLSIITHTFNTAGDFQITLIAKDNEATSSEPASAVINVAEKLETMLIISEVQIRDLSSANHDFIELFNPTTTSIDISGFQLKKKSSTGKKYSIHLLSDNSIIPAQSHFLWVNSDYNHLNELADATSTQTLARNNSIALLDKNKNIIDAVAWGSSTDPFVENIPFPQNPSENQSLGRRIDTENNYIDTDDNSQDFEFQSPTPTNFQGERGDVIPPEKVQDFQAASSTNNAVFLTWSTTTDPDTPTSSISYIIYWSKDEGITQNNLTITASTTATATTLTLSDLYYDSTYYFGIQAFDNLQYSTLTTTTPLAIPKETPQWQMFGYDPQRTFQCPYAGPTTSTLKWAYSLPEDSQFWTGPVVDQNGTIYIGTSDLLALKEENNQPIKKWSYNLDSRAYQTPLIGQDGTIYIIILDKILAISPAGTLKWEIDINTLFSSGGNQYQNVNLVMANNIIYYAAPHGAENKPCLLSINPDNGSITLLYVFAEENPSNNIPSTPTIGKDGTIYISFDKTIFAFDSEGGLKWQKIFELHQECDGNYSNSILNISIDNNKIIYFVVSGTSYSGSYCKATLYAVSENFINNSTTTLTQEEIKWEYNDKLGNTEILIAESGNIYLNNAILMYGNWEKNILAINSEGDPIAISIEGWDNKLFTPKILDKNENIYGKYGTHYTDLMALILEENKYWSSKQDSNFTPSFAIMKNNTLLAPSLHALYAFE